MPTEELSHSKQELALDEWRTMRFDEFAENIAVRIDPAEANGGIYVGLEHLDSESLRIRRCGTADDVIGQKLKFSAGDIIFGRRRAYQRKLGLAERSGICSAHAMVVRAIPDAINSSFLPYFMQSDLFMERAVAISVGSLSPTINWKTMRRQEFTLPPVTLQRQISTLLAATDETLEAFRHTRDSLVTLKRALIYATFEDNPKSFTLGELSTFVTSGSRGWAKYYSDDGSVFIRITNLNRDSIRLDYSDTKYVNEPSSVEADRTRVETGDLLVSITADLGMVAVVKDADAGGFINQHIGLVRIDQSKVIPEFAAYYLTSNAGQRQFYRLNDQGAKAALNLKTLQRIRVPASPMEVQRKTVAAVRAVDERIRECDEQIRRTHSLRFQMLNHYLVPPRDDHIV